MLRAVAIIGVLAVSALALLSWLAPEPVERSQALGLPQQAGAADLVRGQRVFQQNCAVCHGRDLRGTAEGPPLLHPYYRPDHHADAAFYMAVKNGVAAHHWQFGNMPPVAGVEPEQVRDIVAYVRDRQRAVGLIE